MIQWSFGILTSSKFVTGLDPISCSVPECVSVYLPGGLETARQRTGNLNATLLNGTLLDGASAVLINNAPGYHLEFFPLDRNFQFQASDCMIFGQSRNEGLYLCVSSNGNTTVAGTFLVNLNVDLGLSVCPSSLFYATTPPQACFSDLSWTQPLQETTSLNVFKRYSTVAYDRQNLSILSVQSISPPHQIQLDIPGFHSIYTKLFTLDTNYTDDIKMTNSVLYQIGWVLRLQLL